jgi:phosphoribosyl-AMP cyclohydrolase
MVAYMNREALDRTLATGRATYYSRSRQKLWKKGEESGHVQQVHWVLVDCDQDCLILKVSVDAGQCHVGYQSCFYRALKPGSEKDLEFIAERVYDPEATYKKTYDGGPAHVQGILSRSALFLGCGMFEAQRPWG